MPKPKEPFSEEDYLIHLLLALQMLMKVSMSWELQKAHDLIMKRHQLLVEKHNKNIEPKL